LVSKNPTETKVSVTTINGKLIYKAELKKAMFFVITKVMYNKEIAPEISIPAGRLTPVKTLRRSAMAAHIAPTSNSLRITPLQAITCCVHKL